jgi:phage regulator Rha-like protein
MNTVTANDTVESALAELVLTIIKDAAWVDSRLLAQHLDSHHQSVIENVKNYQADFEALGKVRFETEASPGSRTGQSVKFVMLNEDQSFLLLTYSRNTARVRALKLKLIQAFRAARQAVELYRLEYLPAYRHLHHLVHQLAMESSNENRVHMNVNKLVNKAAGVEAGQRASASLPQQAMLIVCQDLATKAMHGATDHHDGYQRAKQRLQALAAVTQLGGGDV